MTFDYSWIRSGPPCLGTNPFGKYGVTLEKRLLSTLHGLACSSQRSGFPWWLDGLCFLMDYIRGKERFKLWLLRGFILLHWCIVIIYVRPLNRCSTENFIYFILISNISTYSLMKCFFFTLWLFFSDHCKCKVISLHFNA